MTVLVFPGGDHESMRPLWQASRVDFNGRQGFLKIVREANVPVVPLGIRGSHFTTPIVYRSGKWLPRLLGLPYVMGFRKRFPLTLAGVLGVAALVVFGPLWTWWLTAIVAVFVVSLPISQLPWTPWTIRMRFGPPMAVDELFAVDDLAVAYERVRSAVEAEVRRVA